MNTLPQFTRIAAVIIAVSLGAAPRGTPGATIRVWKVGSPHTGDVPPTTVSPVLRQQLRKRGIGIEVQSFPAKGFAEIFSDAAGRNAAPDVIAFDNFGVMHGIVTRGERFAGIGEEPTLRRDLVRVTGAYDDLLDPRRGWVYLFASSANHDTARKFALLTPPCEGSFATSPGNTDFVELAPMVASAYLEGEAATLQLHADPERMTRLPLTQKPVKVGAALACGVWGNSKLAFVRVLASYQGEDMIGRFPVMLVFRKTSSHWQLLVTARDPVTTGVFTKELDSLVRLLHKDAEVSLPSPATRLRPAGGMFPVPAAGLRFGVFSWEPSQSDDVVMEIGEFAYKDDARLFLKRVGRQGSRSEISTGQLWSTRDQWSWRIWSVNRNGDVTFSETKSFYH
jgi:hypothetical protein